eukprot:11059432-Alexandrium_andersonii.AAC.1
MLACKARLGAQFDALPADDPERLRFAEQYREGVRHKRLAAFAREHAGVELAPADDRLGLQPASASSLAAGCQAVPLAPS